MKKILHQFSAVLLALTLLGVPGCAMLDKSGVYQGDQVLYQSELQIRTAYDVVHTFVKWELENRAALSKWPEIAKAADNMRKNSPQWFASANALHDVYKADSTAENASKLNASIDFLRTALTEATKYMSVVATQPLTKT